MAITKYENDSVLTMRANQLRRSFFFSPSIVNVTSLPSENIAPREIVTTGSAK